MIYGCMAWSKNYKLILTINPHTSHTNRDKVYNLMHSLTRYIWICFLLFKIYLSSLFPKSLRNKTL